jgi:hypothetical protein
LQGWALVKVEAFHFVRRPADDFSKIVGRYESCCRCSEDDCSMNYRRKSDKKYEKDHAQTLNQFSQPCKAQVE